MSSESSRSHRIADHFARLTDHRRKKVTHPLINIITIALCGSIAGADDFVAMRKLLSWATRSLFPSSIRSDYLTDSLHDVPARPYFFLSIGRMATLSNRKSLIAAHLPHNFFTVAVFP